MTVWITGASSGIGEACAYEYAAQGAGLLLTASRADRLEAVASECLRRGARSACVLPYDLQDPEGIPGLCSKAWEMSGGIDILFCNAGVSQRTKVEDTSMEMIRKIMEINYFAPVAICKELLPRMTARGHGKIAVTTSIAGRFGFPLRCGYSSSKFALYGFFETLAAEQDVIDVTIVCPGRVNTNISMNALVEGGARYGKMDPGQAGGLNSAKAARKIVRAISKGKREVLVGRKELLMVYIKRFFPGLCSKLAKNLKPV